MNWGILGCANIAINSVIPAILRAKNQKLIAVCSRSAEKADAVANQFSAAAQTAASAAQDGFNTNNSNLPNGVIDAINAPQEVKIGRAHV